MSVASPVCAFVTVTTAPLTVAVKTLLNVPSLFIALEIAVAISPAPPVEVVNVTFKELSAAATVAD